ncbi:Peptidoglycan-binding lysin domain-containing protein [Aspergillus oryzae]|uniref:Peptidoglycan-binding lysin domain-containing protein n=1 Tax=Aspergillus oryzae TaxID=5062 RepID=A0A1S9DUZ2_ASPOZ|nr:Peptidoglycan-binding lysin domain-containing protein [Aspergillus oryzae]
MPDMSTWTLYGQSKLANTHYCRALAQRHPDIKFVSIHPGLVKTNLGTEFMSDSNFLVSAALKFAMRFTAVNVREGAFNSHPSYDTTLCRDLALDNGISVEDLVKWNPSFEKDMNNCTVWSAYSYCVKKYENSTSTQFTWTYCLRIDATEAGTVSECNYFTSINGYDAGGDCDTALWANLSSTASRAVCIGVGSKSAAATTTISTVSETATSTTVFMGPTQTGVVSGCQLFHTVVDGDDFPSIESDYGITLAQFYQLNPSIGSTCNTLWLGYAYCVKGPSSSATATAISSTASPNGHTQAGTVSNCNLYHTVVSGDSCDHIEITYGISFAQLLRLVGRFPTDIGRTLYLATRQYSHKVRTTMNISDNDRPHKLSKRVPTMETNFNHADRLERLLQKDRYKTWGFVIYRCTYRSDSDWNRFMTRLLSHVTEYLEFYNGLDLLDSFAPTVFEDQSFDGATTTLLRKHFQEWLQQHRKWSRQMIILASHNRVGIASSSWSETGFVRLVNGVWKPEEPDEEELEELEISDPSELEIHEPLEGCALEDVGWMKVSYEDAETRAFLKIGDNVDWSSYYQRPPCIVTWI